MTYPFGPPFSHQQKVVLALLPKITGFISGIFSTYMITMILRDKNRMKRIYHRIMLGISIADLSSAIWLGLSTWPIPKGKALWAVGNATTCSLQGFWTQFGFICPAYNGSLSIYYLLAIRYGWKEPQFLRIEKYLHGVPILFSLVTAVTGLIMKRYASATLWCWVSPLYPKFRYIAYYGPLWLIILMVTVNAVLVFDHVRKIEKAAQKHSFEEQYSTYSSSIQLAMPSSQQGFDPLSTSFKSNSNSGNNEGGGASTTKISTDPVTINNNNPTISSIRLWKRQQRKITVAKMKRTREVANQSFLYAGTFYFSWFALTATRIISQVNGRVYYPLLVFAVITVPMQSLPNLLVYMLPRFRKLLWYQKIFGMINTNKSSHRSSSFRKPTTVVSSISTTTKVSSSEQTHDPALVETNVTQHEEDMEEEEEEDKPIDAENWEATLPIIPLPPVVDDPENDQDNDENENDDDDHVVVLDTIEEN